MFKSLQCVPNINNILKQTRITSLNYTTKPKIITSDQSDQQNELKKFENMSKIKLKTKTKQPQKPPFVKNLLLGIFDLDILTYPELDKEDLENLNTKCKKAQAALEQLALNDEKSLSSKTILQTLGKENLLGLQAPEFIGGSQLNESETCRILELIGNNSFKHSFVNNEVLGIQTILKFGSEYLKGKYLPALIRGEALSAFCIINEFPNEIDVLKRTAIVSSDKNTWVLNGEKQTVLNASSADLFIVIAKTDIISKDVDKEQKLTAFIVERDFGGVTTSRTPAIDPNLELSNVTFQNTRIPTENIIGSVGAGQSILSTIYQQHRLSTGPLCLTLLKQIINKSTQHYIETSKKPYLLFETDAVRAKMGEWTTALYAAESTVYLTTGIMDMFEKQDCELETTIVKVFCSEQALTAAMSLIDLLGAEATLETHWSNSMLNEALCHVAGNDSNDNLKIILALFGLQHAGKQMDGVIKKMRNPLYHGAFVFRKMWQDRRQSEDNPKLNLFLSHELHPGLYTAGQQLEYSVLRLQYATGVLLSRHGPDVVNKHIDLRRLADCIIDVYAMTACVSRASRSYCIGLQHGEFEMGMANTFCIKAMERVKANVEKIVSGQYHTNDENHRMISKRLFNFKQYFPVHPLTRNY